MGAAVRGVGRAQLELRPRTRGKITRPDATAIADRAAIAGVLEEVKGDGPTRLLCHAVGTIGARSTPGGGRCFHCDGTRLARPLWESASSAGQAQGEPGQVAPEQRLAHPGRAR